MIEKLKNRLESLVFREEGGKKRLNVKRIFIFAVFILLTYLSFQFVMIIFKSDVPPSSFTKSDVSLMKNRSATLNVAVKGKVELIGGITPYVPAPPKKSASGHRAAPIRYAGKQVILPDDNAQRIPSGANFIGKLLASIDTRSQQLVHVILPYGGSHKPGGGSFPPDTILTGQFSYSGDGDRVFIIFNRAVLPDGQEVAIQAQALSSKDYRAGIVGDYHGNKGSRMASVLGLSMVSGISEVMVEKQGLGQGYNVAPKSTIKNGIYNGIAKVAEAEANEQVAQLAQTPKYDTGMDLIISLGESFGTNER